LKYLLDASALVPLVTEDKTLRRKASKHVKTTTYTNLERSVF